MLLRQLFDPYLAQYAYLIGCQRSGEALLLDPERDIDRYSRVARENNLRITAVAETHIHADFVSGAAEFAADPNVHLYLSDEGGPDWTYQWPKERPNTHRLKHGDTFKVGNIRVEAIHTPGHTPEHMSYLITDLGGGAIEPMALATGDFLFVGDVGRPDLLETAAGKQGVMEPSARQLQSSLEHRLAPFADFLQILPGHGAGSACGKSLGAVPTSTLGYERRYNSPLKLALGDGEAFLKDILSGQPEPPLYFATMKRVNRDGIRVTGGVLMPTRLGVSELKNLLQDPNLRVLDARDDRAVFARGHLKHSIHTPLHGPFFSAAAGSYVDVEEEIILVLEGAGDLDLAVRQLYRIGLDRVVGWLTVGEIQEVGLLTEVQPRIDFTEFHGGEAVEKGLLLDVRTSKEFADGHIEGAFSIPYTRLRARLSEIPKNRHLFVHCGSGKRAALAASFLRAEGFEATHVDGACAECERIAESRGILH